MSHPVTPSTRLVRRSWERSPVGSNMTNWTGLFSGAESSSISVSVGFLGVSDFGFVDLTISIVFVAVTTGLGTADHPPPPPPGPAEGAVGAGGGITIVLSVTEILTVAHALCTPLSCTAKTKLSDPLKPRFGI